MSPRPRLLPTLLLATAAGCASSAPRTPGPSAGRIPFGVRYTASTVEYDVTAASVPDLYRELLRAGPEVEGRRFAGATTWRIGWTYRHETRGLACALTDVRATVATRVELPRWRPDAPADSAAARWWEGYRARLVEHELGHVRLALQAGGEVVEALRPLTGAPCAALGQQANAIGQGVLLRLRDAQAAYDRETRHGMLAPAAGTAAR